jgi:glycolate oxidase FAD binding subunit
MTTALADRTDELLEQVCRAVRARTPLRIAGGGSKAFLGREVQAEPISTLGHHGIVNYDPTELVVTARAGTTVADLLAVLDAAGQMLPCEPPLFGGAATVGGMVATGLSGPRRPWSGAVRDFVLGARLLTSQGKHLRFGGEVMKNVAGYDVSRMLTGSYGCLGLITEVSLKVLPRPRMACGRRLEVDQQGALDLLAGWARGKLPLAGACWSNGQLHVRLEGGAGTVAAAANQIGGEASDLSFWPRLRDHSLDFFGGPQPLWRLSLPPDTAAMELPGAVMLDWAGAQRWLKSDAPAAGIQELAARARGTAMCYNPSADRPAFPALHAVLLRYHRQLKQRLDPHGTFNPGRMYADF